MIAAQLLKYGTLGTAANGWEAGGSVELVFAAVGGAALAGGCARRCRCGPNRPGHLVKQRRA